MDGAEPGSLDLARLRRQRMDKLQAAMADKGIDALVLLTSGGVLYSTGAWTPLSDTGQTLQLRPLALVVAGDPAPHLFTAWWEGAPPELPTDHLHRALRLQSPEGVEALAHHVKDVFGGTPAVVGVDDYTTPMWQLL
ncbi:MAG: aminopeptidase P family N-terminal domain-containing protein, partial [Acidimicrobiales bacterium]